LDEFVMVVQPEIETLVRSLESGDIDMVEILPAPETAAIQGTEGLSVAIYDLYSVTYVVLNVDNLRVPAFSDQRVRQAMYQAIDRDSITRDIFLGFGEAAIGTQPPLSPAYDPNQLQPPYAYDPAAASQLLADAGWSDSNDNGIVDKDGDDLKLSIVYVGGEATVDSLLSYMQEAWRAVGIQVELQNISGEVLQERLFDGDFDLSLIAINLTPDGNQGLLFTCVSNTTGFNFGSYCNPDYDAIDARQLREFDTTKRTELQVNLNRIIWTDLPVLPIRFGVARTGYNNRIHNFFPNGYGFLWSLPFVWVESGS
jgi:peptide/nickel transport system substrate-binding protein